MGSAPPMEPPPAASDPPFPAENTPPPAAAAPAMAACDIHLGHEDSQCVGYDIWSANCHTAANNFCRLNPDKIDRIGILSCTSLAPSSPAGHTANWEVKPDGEACIYNWGTACCWATDGAIPPDISQGRGQECAQRACGTQYGVDTTVTLPAGQLVETPGHAVCAGSQAMRDQYGASASGCFTCCDERASYWSSWCRPAPEGGVGPTLSLAQCFEQRQSFLQQCQILCNGYYEAGQGGTANLTLAERQGRACYASTSLFSAASYFEQCRGCCLDNAGRTYAPADYPACVAQCGAP